VPKLCATSAANSAFSPDVRHAINRWFQNFDWFGAAKTFAAIFENSHLHTLSRKHM
jgi:hypothetical protein